MRTIKTISEMKASIRSQKLQGKTIGFVPTMGYLHEGHVSLIKASKRDDDFTVMSIFVNPTQFDPNEDFDKYPRDLNRDNMMAEAAGVDIIFLPSIEEMYPKEYKTYVNVEKITEILCGNSRMNHFKGVTTVVTKLFNIVEPDRAYFGQKDAQQATVIKSMVKDLNLSVEIVVCPIVREEDGLAMSSRNIYLSEEERKGARILSKSLFETQELIEKGERDQGMIIQYLTEKMRGEPLCEVEYIEALSANTLMQVNPLHGEVLILLGARFGKTRLIDNVRVNIPKY